jgi:5-methylcytosine-specific restriction endonuclease McrA
MMTMALFKRSPLKRSTKPINKVSQARRKRAGKLGKLGIVRLYGKAKSALRLECYKRDGGCCVECRKPLPFDGPLKLRAHMAHIVGLGAGGSDVLSNVRTLCYIDHIEKEHNAGGKPVPAKARQYD